MSKLSKKQSEISIKTSDLNSKKIGSSYGAPEKLGMGVNTFIGENNTNYNCLIQLLYNIEELREYLIENISNFNFKESNFIHEISLILSFYLDYMNQNAKVEKLFLLDIIEMKNEIESFMKNYYSSYITSLNDRKDKDRINSQSSEFEQFSKDPFKVYEILVQSLHSIKLKSKSLKVPKESDCQTILIKKEDSEEKINQLKSKGGKQDVKKEEQYEYCISHQLFNLDIGDIFFCDCSKRSELLMYSYNNYFLDFDITKFLEISSKDKLFTDTLKSIESAELPIEKHFKEKSFAASGNNYKHNRMGKNESLEDFNSIDYFQRYYNFLNYSLPLKDIKCIDSNCNVNRMRKKSFLFNSSTYVNLRIVISNSFITTEDLIKSYMFIPSSFSNKKIFNVLKITDEFNYNLFILCCCSYKTKQYLTIKKTGEFYILFYENNILKVKTYSELIFYLVKNLYIPKLVVYKKSILDSNENSSNTNFLSKSDIKGIFDYAKFNLNDLKIEIDIDIDLNQIFKIFNISSSINESNNINDSKEKFSFRHPKESLKGVQSSHIMDRMIVDLIQVKRSPTENQKILVNGYLLEQQVKNKKKKSTDLNDENASNISEKNEEDDEVDNLEMGEHLVDIGINSVFSLNTESENDKDKEKKKMIRDSSKKDKVTIKESLLKKTKNKDKDNINRDFKDEWICTNNNCFNVNSKSIYVCLKCNQINISVYSDLMQKFNRSSGKMDDNKTGIKEKESKTYINSNVNINNHNHTLRENKETAGRKLRTDIMNFTISKGKICILIN